MKPGKLAKRLKKELLGNPKQAAVLAIVCLVACWFWSPLLMKWFSGKSAVTVSVKTGVDNDPVVAPAKIATTPAGRKNAWCEVNTWRMADPLTRSASLARGTRDPFESKQPVVAEVVAERGGDAEAVQPTIAIVPAQAETLGLTLEAIVYGGSRRLAQINGQTLRENDEVKLGGEARQAEGTSIVGRVLTIRSDEVLIEFGSRTVHLKLRPKQLGRGEVVQRGPR